MDAKRILAIVSECEANKGIDAVTLRLYADSMAAYLEADKNIRENGAIVAHPRTNAPMDNPYLKVRTTAARALRALRCVEGDAVLEAVGNG